MRYLFYLFPFNTSDGETRAGAGRKELLHGMERVVWKKLERDGGYGWNGGVDGFCAKIQLFSDTAKFVGVIRKCLNYAFRLKVVKLPYS